MDTNGNGKRGLPTLREIIRRQRQDSDGGCTDSPDLEFIYDDTDTHINEISELYSYTEQPELQYNVKAFEDQMEVYNLLPSWQRLSLEKRKSVVMKLLDQLEVSSRPLRMRSARCLLYIAQGCWAEMQSDAEQQQWARCNSMLLYKLGVFTAFTDLLNIEFENSTAAHVAMRKIAISLADSQDLRVILSVLYTITEVIRNEKDTQSTEYEEEVKSFCHEIASSSGDDMLIIKLLSMVTRFCSGSAPHFPMKKVLLLLWKLILVFLGGMNTLKDLKLEKRKKMGLPLYNEDTLEITKTMRSSSPPASASDLLEAQNQKRNARPFRRSLIKQSVLDDHDTLDMVLNAIVGIKNEDVNELQDFDENQPPNESNDQIYHNNHETYRPISPPSPNSLILPKGLPWKPKVRQKDIDLFLDTARMKFLGYSLPGDRTTLFGLPEPIHEGLKTLNEHIYLSLSEIQVQKEEEIARNPISTSEGEIELTPTEILYQAMLPNLPQYMIALLKILLAAAPTSKTKTDSINIMADVLPEEMPIPILDFPSCVIGDQPELTSERLEIGDLAAFSWRNMFSCINLLRILNKLTKWKHSRIMMLVVFKSAPILKRTLKVRHAMTQLYVLKLLKMQTKYLGRQWRKSNMKTISAIYQKVRHRLNDDWAYGNDLDARPWDFQAEECALRASVDRFNNRRYTLINVRIIIIYFYIYEKDDDGVFGMKISLFATDFLTIYVIICYI
uniref:Striatin-interacting protein 1 n=1 Tax=Diabrotica virgifera virgifera TaxID=50390 RepID=A0A6P7FVY9_DIAVI